ncbi:TlpA disulfide reductase family protein [Pedobacter sp. SYP-B3415]|uniref:TlpA disulfide reductase family protein n=1 Tax=Pedobacter sp. SYP-B3415 TaxID=2496641 RepID=UPI00101D32E7|nr:TlpA disulfide reductase family protein [Pedobacter sp. SYP-B3415]
MQKNLLYVIFGLFAGLFFSSCSPSEARFDVSSKHFGPNGTMGIYRPGEKRALAALNLNNTKQQLTVPGVEEGYYLVEISNGQARTDAAQFSRHFIYLKGGSYQVTADTAAAAPYPVTGSDVAEQQELTDFYKISESKMSVLRADVAAARKKMENTIFDDIRQVTAEEERLRLMLDEGAVQVIADFASKYPGSIHTPFLLDDLDEATNFPKQYKTILLGTDQSVQQDKLAIKLLRQAEDALGMIPGAKMAAIAGKTPDGRTFDPATDLKRLNLIIVWASYDNQLRKRHPELVRFYHAYKGRGLQIIGVSLDKNEKWRRSAIDHDALPWPQFSDLMGAQSPNASKLSGMMHPYMFLVDQQGKIIRSKLLPEEAISEAKSRL